MRQITSVHRYQMVGVYCEVCHEPSNGWACVDQTYFFAMPCGHQQTTKHVLTPRLHAIALLMYEGAEHD